MQLTRGNGLRDTERPMENYIGIRTEHDREKWIARTAGELLIGAPRGAQHGLRRYAKTFLYTVP